MDMSQSSNMAMTNMTGMASTLFFSTSTPYLSTMWAPTSSGGYAGTCIFLALLAIIFRTLLALKSLLEARWLNEELKRRYVTVVDRPRKAGSIASDESAEKMVLSSNGVEENVALVQSAGARGWARPFRLRVDVLRGLVDTVIAGVGYLLMLGVMTMNAGYFLSILAGTFVGSIAVGRFYSGAQH